MKKQLFAVVLSMVCATAFAAEKTGGDPKAAPEFGALDADKDGYISMDESKAWPHLSSELFAETDHNKDGRLDEAEFSALEPNE